MFEISRKPFPCFLSFHEFVPNLPSAWDAPIAHRSNIFVLRGNHWLHSDLLPIGGAMLLVSCVLLCCIWLTGRYTFSGPERARVSMSPMSDLSSAIFFRCYSFGVEPCSSSIIFVAESYSFGITFGLRSSRLQLWKRCARGCSDPRKFVAFRSHIFCIDPMFFY